MKNELHRKTFELTLALYRVTDFFPQGEALRRSLREKANEIFGGVTEYGYAGGNEQHEQEALAMLAKVQTIKGYLQVSRFMQFVRPVNLTILEREYEFLEHFFEGELSHQHTPARRMPDKYRSAEKSEVPEIQQPAPRNMDPGITVTERQRKILAYVHRTPQAKISDFHAFFADVSTKTIQRDLHDLVERNVLKKEGKKRWTMYSLR